MNCDKIVLRTAMPPEAKTYAEQTAVRNKAAEEALRLAHWLPGDGMIWVLPNNGVSSTPDEVTVTLRKM